MKGLKDYSKWMKAAKITAAICLSAACVQVPFTGFAASKENIRVAMFADLGSKYKSTVPAITLKSDGGWSIGQSNEGNFRAWTGLAAGQPVRFSVDGFRVKVLETGDAASAASAAKKLQGTSDKPIVFIGSKNGSSVYQLYTGTYATEAGAQTAVQRIASAVGGQPVVTGNKHWAVGNYGSEQEANLKRTTIAAAGFDAFTVVQSGGQYSVWVGEASNDNKLSALKSSMSDKFPDIMLSRGDASEPALIIRQEAAATAGTQAMKHYMVSGADSGKIMVHGEGSGIQVLERSQRTYRGDMEISKISGQLALVNELPLEQYLYSVVGAEVYSSWPAESLKAQAVAARSYALFQGEKFQIANVVDTTLSQAYNGISTENANVNKAVDATTGEVLESGGKIVEAVFSSNAGGATADPSEVWNSPSSTFASVDSSGDKTAQTDTHKWYHVLLTNGKSGYIREDNVKEVEGVTEAGLSKVTVTSDNTNVRPIPQIQTGTTPVAQMQPGNEAVVLEKVSQSGDYEWVRGPYTSDQIIKSLQGKINSAVPTSIEHMDVTKRGPSGRVLVVEANGQPLSVKYPDTYRSAMGGLPSTLFDITGTGSYTVLGADGVTGHLSGAQGAKVISGNGTTASNKGSLVIMNGGNQARVVDKTESFIFVGKGNGHGLGMSQWGAKGLADQGYDYKKILQHYYQNVAIVKD